MLFSHNVVGLIKGYLIETQTQSMSSIHPVQSNFLIPNKPNQTKPKIRNQKTELNSIVVFFVGRVIELV